MVYANIYLAICAAFMRNAHYYAGWMQVTTSFFIISWKKILTINITTVFARSLGRFNFKEEFICHYR